MDGTEYERDSARIVLDLLKDTFGSYFKEYFDGEPEDLTDMQLPCLAVGTPKIAVEMGATATDDITEQVIITLILNKKDDFGAKTSDNLTMFRARKLIMGQLPGDGNTITEYAPNTILYTLRKYITLNGRSTNNRIDVEFDINRRGEDTWTQEAYITLTIDRQALVQTRQ